ncbi:hypothetical protein GBA52_007335 [Prunus armeniaca]|nr:hypothetical protein GBA52_007335 [Prunus armeniaca]
MSEQEEDLICRMYKLVGDRWGLIAGRIPGRKAEEIERFWLMRHGEGRSESHARSYLGAPPRLPTLFTFEKKKKNDIIQKENHN